MAYQLIVMGWDANDRLVDKTPNPIVTGSGGGAVPPTVLAKCGACSGARRIVVSPSAAGGYAEGANDLATDTAELYVIEFPAKADGWAWMRAFRNDLIGKKVYSIDGALGSS